MDIISVLVGVPLVHILGVVLVLPQLHMDRAMIIRKGEECIHLTIRIICHLPLMVAILHNLVPEVVALMVVGITKDLRVLHNLIILKVVVVTITMAMGKAKVVAMQLMLQHMLPSPMQQPLFVAQAHQPKAAIMVDRILKVV